MKKKIVYYLSACDEIRTLNFLYQSHNTLLENKSLPKNFIKKTSDLFKNNNKKIYFKDSDPLLYWKHFCKSCHYEEALPIILHYILKYPEQKICWLLKIKPQNLSYRLNQGLLVLEEEIIKNISKNNKELIFKETLELKNKTAKAIFYLQFLHKQTLPDTLQNIKINNNNKLLLKIFYIVILAIIVFGIYLLLTSYYFMFNKEVILYKFNF